MQDIVLALVELHGLSARPWLTLSTCLFSQQVVWLITHTQHSVREAVSTFLQNLIAKFTLFPPACIKIVVNPTHSEKILWSGWWLNSREHKHFLFFFAWEGNGTGNSGIWVLPEVLNGGAINKPISSLCKKALRSLSLDFAFSFKDWLPGFKYAPEQAPEIHQIPAGIPGTAVLPELLSLLPATPHFSTGHCGFLAARAAVTA